MNFMQKMMASLTAPKKKLPSWRERQQAQSARHKKRAQFVALRAKIKKPHPAYGRSRHCQEYSEARKPLPPEHWKKSKRPSKVDNANR